MHGAASELIDALIDRGRFNVARDYALTFSISVLADFLGVDRRDAGRLVDWGNDLIASFNDPEITVAGTERMARSASALATYALTSLAAGHAKVHGGFLARAAHAAEEHARTRRVAAALFGMHERDSSNRAPADARSSSL
jgi:cytochrome P450